MISKQSIDKIIFPKTGEPFAFSGESSPTLKPVLSERVSVSLEPHFGTFGLFNIDDSLTKADFSFGATPSVMFRLQTYFSVGAECMLPWGQVRTDDPLRFIINPSLRGEFTFPVHPRVALQLIAAAGLSIWPVYDTTGILDSTFFSSADRVECTGIIRGAVAHQSGMGASDQWRLYCKQQRQ